MLKTVELTEDLKRTNPGEDIERIRPHWLVHLAYLAQVIDLDLKIEVEIETLKIKNKYNIYL
jgi:hypothetical protein